MPLYPLKFKPRFVEKMWGGRKIESVLHKPLPAARPIGESWELFDFPPGVVENSTDWISSEVINGPLAGKTLHQLVAEFGPALYGNALLVGPQHQFPLLIKYLDAREDLSVQVHPDEQYAAAHPGAHLKSEAWYIVQADGGARLLKGLNPGVTRESFDRAIHEGNVESQINAIAVKPGECFYLPSGTVHALGAGILAAEVQTPSDTTFRVFDFNRLDPSTGKLRTLHVEQALQCISFDEPAGGKTMSGNEARETPSPPGRLVCSEYFTIDKIEVAARTTRQLVHRESAVWMILAGSGTISAGGIPAATPFASGDTLLLPADLKNPTLKTHGDCVWLQVGLPR